MFVVIVQTYFLSHRYFIAYMADYDASYEMLIVCAGYMS